MVAKKRNRSVQDTTWGLVTLPPFVWKVVDTMEFNRLRDLRQTGLLHYVFPGATHNRLSHSLGTAALAYALLQRLDKNQPELELTPSDIHTTVLAALCHDLGHGPCSHAFEHFMHIVDPSWCHEHQSVMMLKHIVAVNGLEAHLHAVGASVHMACEMILGSKDAAPPDWEWHGPQPNKEFLFDVVSNALSGMDVDKWDYLRRDAIYLNIHGPPFESDRLMEHCRVLRQPKGGSHLAWPLSESSTVMNMFLARYDLHDRAYQQRPVRVIDRMAMHGLYMMKDFVIGKAADGTPVKLADAHRHPEVYAKTTDWVLDMAIRGTLADIPDAALTLLQRIPKRQLWACVGQITLPAAYTVKTDEFAAELVALGGSAFSLDHFVVDLSHVNCGKGRYDPMNKVIFFEEMEDKDGQLSIQCVDKVIDYLRPAFFQRRKLRVFVKDVRHIGVVEDALALWNALPGNAALVISRRPWRSAVSSV